MMKLIYHSPDTTWEEFRLDACIVADSATAEGMDPQAELDW